MVKVRSTVQDHLLKSLIDRNAEALGRKAGKEAAHVFLIRLKEVFVSANGGRESCLFRPAVENHEQNHDFYGPYNRFVEGLSSTMLGWIDTDATAAESYVQDLLNSGSEIVERVAIHLVDQRFEILKKLVTNTISPSFFDSGHLHELYLLLKNHFRQFTKDAQAATLDAIRNLPQPDGNGDSARALQRDQRNWLTAIAGHGYEPAETWLNELDGALGARESFFHPDFNNYLESRYGFGPTPHTIQDLVGFAQSGGIVEELNAFSPPNTWDGPTVRSLSDAVIEAVGAAPQTFIDLLPKFLSAKPEYQYAVIAGFKKLWVSWDGNQPGLPWATMWPKLFDFFEGLLKSDDFWKSEVSQGLTLSPTVRWIPPVVSELLRAGTQNDDKSYSEDLLPRTGSLIAILLQKSEPRKEVAEGDARNSAINTAKGKAIEALLDYALRCCRLSDRADGQHATTWRGLQPLFDDELSACKNGNFDFSALAGAYIVNLHYMSADWAAANFKRIFPLEFPLNCLSALDGLAFAPTTKALYADLIGSGVVDWALRQRIRGDRIRETLLQRIGLAYLWEQECLDGPRFSYLFGANRVGDLGKLTDFFWVIRSQPLEESQKERIFLFWDRCVIWSKSAEASPADLLAALSRLSCFLTSIDGRSLKLLLAVAPFASVNYNVDGLVEQLARFAESHASEVGQVLLALLNGYQPTYDYEDRLKNLIVLLAHNPASRADAILCCELALGVPGMVQLYSQLPPPQTASPQ